MFITFEGLDGVGKTTQVRMLQQALIGLQHNVLVTREPGGTRIGARIRSLLLDERNSDLTPTAELFLYLADRSQHLAEVILPALKSGKWVLCDRFVDATIAYQGYARGGDIGWISELNARATGSLSPDLTFLLDCPVEVALGRIRHRNNAASGRLSEKRFDMERIEFHRKVREGYLALAGSSNGKARYRVVDASRSAEAIHRVLLLEVLDRLRVYERN
ncbi:MAG: dTMP kinase [Deltaproteobacteria bacterium]|nr:dTMP kinase [Deltaproteobacteria bacterium]